MYMNLKWAPDEIVTFYLKGGYSLRPGLETWGSGNDETVGNYYDAGNPLLIPPGYTVKILLVPDKSGGWYVNGVRESIGTEAAIVIDGDKDVYFIETGAQSLWDIYEDPSS